MSIIECTERGSEITPSRCANSVRTFEGAVLGRREENGYDDSDFLATVWDAEEGRVREVMYASTRGWTYHNNATVDATEESIESATAWYRAEWIKVQTEMATRAANTVDKGSEVVSTTTRGKNVGVTGIVRWIGVDEYKSTRHLTCYRVGIKVEGEEKLRYLPLGSVTLVSVPEVDMADIEERSLRATPYSWGTVIPSLAYALVDRTRV